jgi:hypothetical protein
MALTRLLSVGATTALIVIALSTLSNPVELCAGQAQAAPDTGGPQILDFKFFETQVEPIFLEKRPGHARCYVCHGLSGAVGKARSALKLEELSPGATIWTKEQSRRNFAVISKLVTPGEPLKSRLLLHPLATVAGERFTREASNLHPRTTRTGKSWQLGFKGKRRTGPLARRPTKSSQERWPSCQPQRRFTFTVVLTPSSLLLRL